MPLNVISVAAAAVLGVGDAPLTVSATITDDRLATGESFLIDVRMELGDGWSARDAGVSGYIIQLDAPESATPSGEVLTEFGALARNSFLQAPYERMVHADRASIEFTLTGEPADGQIGVNVLAYLTHEDGSATFARRRVDLDVEAGATATTDRQASISTWGLETAGLQIGDKAPTVDLPDKDGNTTSLADAYDDGDVILTTYRAFW